MTDDSNQPWYNKQNRTSGIDPATYQRLQDAASTMRAGTSPDKYKGGSPQPWSSTYSKIPQKKANVKDPEGGSPFAEE